MKRVFRLATMMMVFLLIATLSLSGTVWAGPSQQGTVPTSGGGGGGGPAPTSGGGGGGGGAEATQPPSGGDATLNTGTGSATVPAGAFPPGGKAIVNEETQAELAANYPPLPLGLAFQGNGLNLVILDANGNPVKFFNRSVLICFPATRRMVIRHFDTRLNRWIAFPTTFRNGLVCTRTRLPGTYAPVAAR